MVRYQNRFTGLRVTVERESVAEQTFALSPAWVQVQDPEDPVLKPKPKPKPKAGEKNAGSRTE